jgi:hypothetical protein
MKRMALVWIALVCFLAGGALAQGMFWVEGPSCLPPGEEVEIMIMGQVDAECKGYSLSISFDPTTLEILGCDCTGSLCDAATLVEGCTAADLAVGAFKYGVVYVFSCTGDQIVPGEHCLAKLRVVATPRRFRRYTHLIFEDIELAKNRMDTCEDGSVTPATIDKRFKICTRKWQQQLPEDNGGPAGKVPGEKNRVEP